MLANSVTQRAGERASSTRNILCRTWTTNTGHANDNKSQHVAASAVSPAMQRWLGEPMREEPYHAIGAVADASGPEGEHKKQGGTDSTKAVAGSDEGKKE